jgi:hypothetical protein
VRCYCAGRHNNLFRLSSGGGLLVTEQLGDLRGMLNAYEKTWAERPRSDVEARMPTQSLRDLLRAQDLAEKKDAAALIALCQERGPRSYVTAWGGGEQDFLRSIAAEALAGLGGI